MFSLEKEMIPILKEYLSRKYQISDRCFVSEFNSGNGIADLVFAIEKAKNREPMPLGYDLMYTTLRYFNKKNKKIELNKFIKNTFLEKKQIFSLIDFLVKSGTLEKIDQDEFRVKIPYSPPIKKIISIEAKLTDWKNGFYQALRYKTFSHESYLAISKEFAHRVNLNLLKEYNIGLIIVSENNTKITLKPRKEKPKNLVANAYLSERIMQLTLA